jgi:amphi-Trp domain-containing protein
MKVKEAAQAAREKSADLCSRAMEKTDEMLNEDKFILESLEDPARVTDYLRAVIDGIEKGRIVLTAENQEMVLNPGSLMKFVIKGKRSSTKGKLNIKLSWTRLKEDQGSELTISS